MNWSLIDFFLLGLRKFRTPEIERDLIGHPVLPCTGILFTVFPSKGILTRVWFLQS